MYIDTGIIPMKLAQQVLYAIDDAGANKFESALLHACIAINTTSKRLTLAKTKVRDRYVACLRNYYWILEPMLGPGINLVETKFENIQLKNNCSPDLAEIIYEIFRCSHAHGDEVPIAFSVTPTTDSECSRWILGNGEIHMPDRIIWALLSVAVFSRVNASEKSDGNYYLSLGDHRFLLREWWGREDDFRVIAAQYNQTRVTLDKLGRLEKGNENPALDKTMNLEIIQPYATQRRT